MPSNRPITRRRALRAASGALGGVVGVAGLAGTAASASGYCLKYDWKLHQECPTEGTAEGPVEEAGTPVYEACTDTWGTQYYFVCEDGYGDECEAFGDTYETYVKGWVPPDGVEPC